MEFNSWQNTLSLEADAPPNQQSSIKEHIDSRKSVYSFDFDYH
jgi:hypothetical protein